MDPGGYVQLMHFVSDPRLRKDKAVAYPLLERVTAHAEGADGDFTIEPNEVLSLLREIDAVLRELDESRLAPLVGLLNEFRDLAVRAERDGVTMYGLAD